MSDYLSVDDVLKIHRDQINRYGGSFAVLDQGKIESAVARPQSGYYEGLIAEAAALWESLSQNHPFLDGNKRTAFMATKVFLDLNDKLIVAEPQAVISFIDERFEKHEVNFEKLETWLHENTQDRIQRS